MVVGNRDDATQWARRDVFNKLPANARSQYLEVRGEHLGTPAVAKDDIVRWVMALPGAG
jgi:hypothetical protein